MANTSVITHYRRVKLMQITSGAISTIAPITHIAFGDGGCDSSGEPIVPNEFATALNNEVARYEVESISNPADTTASYAVIIPDNEHSGVSFSEMALVDSDGNLCAIKTMRPKVKDDDVIFTFTFDDEF